MRVKIIFLLFLVTTFGLFAQSSVDNRIYNHYSEKEIAGFQNGLTPFKIDQLNFYFQESFSIEFESEAVKQKFLSVGLFDKNAFDIKQYEHKRMEDQKRILSLENGKVILTMLSKNELQEQYSQIKSTWIDTHPNYYTDLQQNTIYEIPKSAFDKFRAEKKQLILAHPEKYKIIENQ